MLNSMARPLRIALKDGWYHVTVRGYNRQNIFLEDWETARISWNCWAHGGPARGRDP